MMGVKKNTDLETLLISPPGHNAWVVGNEPYTGIGVGTVDMFSKNYVEAP
jgi:hypothetical protein